VVEGVKVIYHSGQILDHNPAVVDTANTIDCATDSRSSIVEEMVEEEEGRRLEAERKKDYKMAEEGSNRTEKVKEEVERRIVDVAMEEERKRVYSEKGGSARERRIEEYADMTSKGGGWGKLLRKGETLRVVAASASRLKCLEELEEREVEVMEEDKKPREEVVESRIACIDRKVEAGCNSMELQNEKYCCKTAFRVEGEVVERRSKIVRNLRRKDLSPSKIDSFKTSTHLDWHSVDVRAVRTLRVAETAAHRGIALVFAAALRNSQTRSVEHTDRSSFVEAGTDTEVDLEGEVVFENSSEDEVDEDSLRSD